MQIAILERMDKSACTSKNAPIFLLKGARTHQAYRTKQMSSSGISKSFSPKLHFMLSHGVTKDITVTADITIACVLPGP